MLLVVLRPHFGVGHFPEPYNCKRTPNLLVVLVPHIGVGHFPGLYSCKHVSPS
jgi:hypothetical protein